VSARYKHIDHQANLQHHNFQKIKIDRRAAIEFVEEEK